MNQISLPHAAWREDFSTVFSEGLTKCLALYTKTTVADSVTVLIQSVLLPDVNNV